MTPSARRRWSTDGPDRLPLDELRAPPALGDFDPAFGRHDPCAHRDAHGRWRAARTPVGPGTLRLQLTQDGLLSEGYGPGGPWLVEQVPRLIGRLDAPETFEPSHPRVRAWRRRFGGPRLGQAPALVDPLIRTILGQRVTGREAKRSYRRLIARTSEAAPGPRPLWLPPDPARVARLPRHAFVEIGVEAKRARTLVGVCRSWRRVEAVRDLSPIDARRRLFAFPGVGVWTVEGVMGRALGDPDAVPVGDFHLRHVVAWALADEPRADDRRMLELLAPFAGHRYRVIRLIRAAGIREPKLGPRRAVVIPGRAPAPRTRW